MKMKKRRTRLYIEALEDRCLLSFSPAVSYDVGAPAWEVVTADFNGDGRLDLATTSSRFDLATGEVFDASVKVLLGNGDGSFLSAVTTEITDPAGSLTVGDFNADGKPDLAMVSGDDYNSGVPVMLGNGDGSFQAPGGVGVGKARSVAVGDFNSDGKMDLAVASDLDPYYPGDVYIDYGLCSVFLSNGDGSFQAPTTPFFSLYPVDAVAVADLNGDAKQDLLVGTSNGSYEFVQVLRGDGQGNFTELAGWRLGHSSSMVAGDLDGDGDADLVTATGSEVRVLRGNGLGGFESPSGGVGYAAGLGPSDVVLGDFNRDGVLDIAAAIRSSDDVGVLLGRGDGTFGESETFAAGSVPYSVAAGDFNGDGWLDVATANPFTADNGWVLINDQSWVAPPRPTISITDASVTEGNAGTVNAAFTVALSAPYSQSVSVNYSTANGTATAGSDFQTASGTLTFAPGETTKTIVVPVNGERLGESKETFVVNLSSPTNATIAAGQGIGTIIDDEPRISITDVSRVEGNAGLTTLFTFTITLSAAYDQAVTMSFRTSNGTAKANQGDYIAKSGTLTFAPGETIKYVTIEVKGDSKKEANETFYLDLFALSSNALFTKNRGVGTILNDD